MAAEWFETAYRFIRGLLGEWGSKIFPQPRIDDHEKLLRLLEKEADDTFSRFGESANNYTVNVRCRDWEIYYEARHVFAEKRLRGDLSRYVEKTHRVPCDPVVTIICGTYLTRAAWVESKCRAVGQPHAHNDTVPSIYQRIAREGSLDAIDRCSAPMFTVTECPKASGAMHQGETDSVDTAPTINMMGETLVMPGSVAVAGTPVLLDLAMAEDGTSRAWTVRDGAVVGLGPQDAPGPEINLPSNLTLERAGVSSGHGEFTRDNASGTWLYRSLDSCGDVLIHDGRRRCLSAGERTEVNDEDVLLIGGIGDGKTEGLKFRV